MDLTESELFENLLETSNELSHIDLHNDFTCVALNYSDEGLSLKFQNDKGQGYVTVQFEEVVIFKLQMPLRSLTIDNFHRGRYELDGKLYDEYKGKKCFYIEFYEGGSIELLCNKASIQIPKSALN